MANNAFASRHSNEYYDPFANDFANEGKSSRPFITLYELNSMVRAHLAATMEPSYWVTAEISELRVASNGHCYLELVEADERSRTPMAKARANIWRTAYGSIAGKFEAATGCDLAAGIKVLVCVTITFHELYGYSLNVTDIDPTYTLGDAERRRREILQQLEDDGVLNLNKELPLPRPLQRIAVISAASAAGYGDFCDQLQQSAYRFTLRLFPATMQGEKTESSVIAALDNIAAEIEKWDAVVIIRGGGAVSDLGSFDSYLLAANVAQFPLPVFTGIGHERDDTVIDAVAHTRLKTPTAVAAFLLDLRREEVETIYGLTKRLNEAFHVRFDSEQHNFERLGQRFHLAVAHLGKRENERLARYAARLDNATHQSLHREHQRLSPFPLRIAAATDRVLNNEHNRLPRLISRLPALVTSRISAERLRLALAEQSMRLANPERILSLGYSITLKDGAPVRNASQLKTGDKIVTRLQSGEIKSIVLEENGTAHNLPNPKPPQ